MIKDQGTVLILILLLSPLLGSLLPLQFQLILGKLLEGLVVKTVICADHLLRIRSEQGHNSLKVQDIDVDDLMVLEGPSIILPPDKQPVVLFQGSSNLH